MDWVTVTTASVTVKGDDIKTEALETKAETLRGNLTEAIPNMFKYYPSYELSNLQVEVEPRELE